MPLSYLIVDDNLTFLESAARLFRSQGIFVAGLASTGEEALRLAGVLRPDVILVDIELGEEDGIALAGQLVCQEPAACVVLISAHADDDLIRLARESPAAGFIPKQSIGLQAIERLRHSRSSR